ncbi:hypothetical protein G6F23_013968 [Rhizopus arrhizus]|nr:hypothetical protein G6F23_013968 [Rhizopus arrhizus]
MSPITDTDTSATAGRVGSRGGGNAVPASARTSDTSMPARQRSAREAISEVPSHTLDSKKRAKITGILRTPNGVARNQRTAAIHRSGPRSGPARQATVAAAQTTAPARAAAGSRRWTTPRRPASCR